MCFRFTKTLWSWDAPRTRSNLRAPCPWARNVPVRRLAETGAERRDRIARQVVRTGHRGHRRPFSRRERRLHPSSCRDPPPRGWRGWQVPRPEARNRGYSYPSLGRVRALQAIPRPWIPPNGPQDAQNGRESGFPGFGGARGSDSCHQSAKEPPKGGSSSPRRSRPTLPASGSIEDHVGRVVGHNGAALAGGPRDGIRGVEHLDAVRSRGGPETPGSEGAQPPASPSGRHTECGHGG